MGIGPIKEIREMEPSLAKRQLARGLLTVVLAVAALAFAAVPAAAGVTINVTTTSDETTAGDGHCSLREAVLFSNGTPEADCAPGSPSGSTTIVAPANSAHYFLTSGVELAFTGSVPVVIDGGGVGTLGTTIDGDALTRVLFVAAGTTVTLNKLSIDGGQTLNGASGGCGGNGCNSPSGGGILNLGNLTLKTAAVTNNAAGNGGTASNGGTA
jgi:CSLREA domain-containing protein